MNQASGQRTVTAAEVPAQAHLVDVREDDEWAAGHAPGALHIPLGSLGELCGQIPRDRDVYVICRAGSRSARACQLLSADGWQVLNVSDGMLGWESAAREMVSESGAVPFVA
jgi:rhodanese-related sulfurtransferase